MQINVIHKKIYGQDRFYPSNENAKTICELMGRETLTHDQLKLCKKTGWEVEIKTEAFKLEDG